MIVELKFVDDGDDDEGETLRMPSIEERDSMWYSSTPVPCMI